MRHPARTVLESSAVAPAAIPSATPEKNPAMDPTTEHTEHAEPAKSPAVRAPSRPQGGARAQRPPPASPCHDGDEFARFVQGWCWCWLAYGGNFALLELSRRSRLGWLFPRGTPPWAPLLLLLLDLVVAVGLCGRIIALLRSESPASRSADGASRVQPATAIAVLVGCVSAALPAFFLWYDLTIVSEILSVS